MDRSKIAGLVALVLVVLGVGMVAATAFLSMGSLPGAKSNKADEKSKSTAQATTFTDECFSDEIELLSDGEKTHGAMKELWEKTKAQPYFLVRAYDFTFASDKDKESWANKFFQNYYNDPNGVFIVYFPAENAKTDYGYVTVMTGSNLGKETKEKLTETVTAYMTKNWETETDKDALFAGAFEEAAKQLKKIL